VGKRAFARGVAKGRFEPLPFVTCAAIWLLLRVTDSWDMLGCHKVVCTTVGSPHHGPSMRGLANISYVALTGLRCTMRRMSAWSLK
jgi:hypothetical protein